MPASRFTLDSASDRSTPGGERPLICFGEILWDILPNGRFPGGAPFNVAYHLRSQGAPVVLASAVGMDDLGAELLARLEQWGIPSSTVARQPSLPTGIVEARIGPRGDARYEIAPDRAWDRIELTPDVLRAAGSARAIIFGSLAQRSSFNRASLDELLGVAAPDAWRVFDVNLRAPHDDLALVGLLASRATLLKLNSEEAARLAGGEPKEGREEQHARRVSEDTGCRWVCVTAGARGAGILEGETWSWETGRPVPVVDTVGAGDAFLATLLLHLLRSPDQVTAALSAACRVGEWVATQSGATPAYKPGAPS